ncbi:uncharacterized protein LOC117340940 [Pecten maximus]|uniref:uncharacterized protein LOC117340940 n=1 Tax=Pecten maximus TaxID=6579 RepID=UPI001458716C|nr:uncharacterized protein LOC117340940 [Pecten maximus]
MEEDIRNERKNLISKLKGVVGRSDEGRCPRNIVLIGSPGCGKSSFINSYAASIADDYWREYAFSGGKGSGKGTADQITVRIKRFEAKEYVTSSRLQGYAFPTLVDISGIQDGECEITEEILRLLFYGELKDNTNIRSVFTCGKNNGIQYMRSKYIGWNTKNSNKVHRIIVVANAMEPIPQNLIQCVMKAARPTGDKYTREIPVFGIMTKIDQVDESSQEFKNRKQTFMEALSLVGVSHRVAQCVNYCDTIDPMSTRTNQTLPDVDICFLRFMNVVCGSNYVVSNPDESYRSIYFKEKRQEFQRKMIIIILAIIMLGLPCLLAAYI